MQMLCTEQKKEKFKAAIAEIEDLYKRGKPVLVGTSQLINQKEYRKY